MTILEKNSCNAAIINHETIISTVQDMLDILAEVMYTHGCTSVILYKESLSEGFFDLKTGIAGELLQKCSNYHVKLAIVGDFSMYTSKSLKDFIYECNKGHQVFFMPDAEGAMDAIMGMRSC